MTNLSMLFEALIGGIVGFFFGTLTIWYQQRIERKKEIERLALEKEEEIQARIQKERERLRDRLTEKIHESWLMIKAAEDANLPIESVQKAFQDEYSTRSNQIIKNQETIFKEVLNFLLKMRDLQCSPNDVIQIFIDIEYLERDDNILEQFD